MAGITTNNRYEPVELVYIDEVNGNLTYIGRAKMGSTGAQAVWQIRRLLKTGTATKIEYTDGNRRFDNIWDDRATLSYS